MRKRTEEFRCEDKQRLPFGGTERTWRCFSKRRENIAIKMLEELEKNDYWELTEPPQPSLY